jgi:hypothetical protein
VQLQTIPFKDVSERVFKSNGQLDIIAAGVEYLRTRIACLADAVKSSQITLEVCAPVGSAARSRNLPGDDTNYSCFCWVTCVVLPLYLFDSPLVPFASWYLFQLCFLQQQFPFASLRMTCNYRFTMSLHNFR